MYAIRSYYASNGSYSQKDLLKYINRKYKVLFSYNDDILFKDKIPFISDYSGTLEELLNKYFSELGFGYKNIAGQVVIYATEIKEQKVILSGYIIEEWSNEVLIGATLYNIDNGVGVITSYSIHYTKLYEPRHGKQPTVRCDTAHDGQMITSLEDSQDRCLSARCVRFDFGT